MSWIDSAWRVGRRLVTGGGTGIGKALAIGFAEAGADVVVCGRTQATLDDAAAAIEATGQRALGVDR